MIGEHLIPAFSAGSVQVFLTIQHELLRCSFGGEGGRAREYYPLVKKEDVALSETKSLLDRVFKGSVNMMMSTLVKSNELSKDEINELQAILKKAGEKAD